MVKIIFFDVGGTLIRPHPSVGDLYSQIASRHGVERIPSEIEARFRAAWKNKKQHPQNIDKSWWRSIVTEVFQGSVFKDPGAFFEDLYAVFEKPESWFVFEEVHETLSALKKRGLRLAVASNWDSRLPRLLDGLSLGPYFDRQFISFQTGCAKPDPLFFKQALKIMKASPIEALHVGDDPVEDLRCAELAGMRAYLIDRANVPKSSRALSSLNELLLRI